MNLLDLMVKIGVDDDASRKIDGIASNIKGGLARAAKAGAIAIGTGIAAATAGVVAIGKQAFDAYANYEQLAGGVEKLFGSASDTVMQNAQRAYMTAGMSANQYMDQTMRFSASLIQSLGGNTEEAAHLADEAMIAMSDNVNVFGSSMEDVQNAFQGFAKQNYTMLDNLRLGYGGTKEEMERLIADAAAATDAQEALGLSVDANSLSFDNIVKAIQVVQYEQGIWGTTAEEASKTVQGSIAMTQAAWQNFLTELGKPVDEANISQRMEELIESATRVVENVTPVIERITAALVKHAPEIANGAMAIGAAILQGIIDGIAQALPGLPDFMRSELVQGIVDAWTPVIDKLREIGDTLGPYVQPALDMLWQVIQDAVLPAVARLGEAVSYFLEQFEPWAPHLMNVATIIGQVLLLVLAAFIDILAATFNIVGTVLEALMAFSDFIEGLPQTVSDMAQQVGQWFSDMDQKICDALDSAGQTVEGWKEDVTNWFTQLDEDMNQKFEDMKKAIGDWATETGAKAREGGQSFYDNVRARFDSAMAFIRSIPQQVSSFLANLPATMGFSGSSGMTALYDGLVGAWNWVTSFVTSIPSRISSMLGNLGNLLWSAGWNVLMGFYNGAVSAWNQMTGWLSSIGGWIQNLKGPLDYDKKLLIENGQAIMEGLNVGLKSGYEDVVDTVSGMGLGIATSMDVSANVVQTGGISGEIASLREELRQMRLVLNIDGRAFAEATVGEMDRAMGNMARRAVAR